MSYTHEINDFRIVFENEEDYLLIRLEYLRGYNDDASGDIPFLMFVDHEMYHHSIAKPSIIYVITNMNLLESSLEVTSLDDPMLEALRNAVSFADSQTPTGNVETTTTHESQDTLSEELHRQFSLGATAPVNRSNWGQSRSALAQGDTSSHSSDPYGHGYTSNPSFYSQALTAEQIMEQYNSVYPENYTEEGFAREYQATHTSLYEDEQPMGKAIEEEPPKNSNIERKPYFETIDLD